jgi:solute carrier family 25 citrate transporter 1
MATGAFAQILAGVVYTPIDIVKERMQVQAMMRNSYSYASPLAAFSSLLHQGRGVSGIFKGYWATNAVWLPWNALYIAGYEELKRICAASMHKQSPHQQQQQSLGGQTLQQQQQLPAWAIASCSATAAAAAAIVTHPFDVVKTRLQVLSAQPQQAGLTALQVAQQQLQREGLRSFSHGLSARLLNIAPGCALSWALYEQLKGWMDEQ